MKLSVLFLLLIAWTSASFAAGTVACTVSRTPNSVWKVTIAWTGDASDGSVPASSTSASCTNIMGDSGLQGMFVVQAETTPGSPAPTNTYAVTVKGPNGVDIAAGQLAALSSTVAAMWSITAPPLNGTLTFALTGNSVHSAAGTVILWLAPGNYARKGSSSGGTSGVSSFDTRTGAVTLTSGDVTTALGFTPATGAFSALTSSTNSTAALVVGTGASLSVSGSGAIAATTATALAANGTNCSAGQFPLGVDASGNSESCTALPTTLTGTANQITVSGATGAITLSIPTNPTLPGTTTGTFSGNLTGNASGSAGTVTSIASHASTELSDTASIAYLAGTNAFTGSDSFSKDLTFSGTLSPTALSGDVNNYNPTGCATALALRIDGGAADRNITGLQCAASAPSDGRIVTIINIGTTNNLVLKNASGSSSAANQFLLPADTTLPINTALALRYDGTSSVWRPWSRALSNTGVTAGTYGGLTVDVAGRVTAASTVLPAANGGTGIANSKTLTVSNNLTFAGTDSTVMTFPTTSATIARTDAANTFTGVQTMTSPALTTPAVTTINDAAGNPFLASSATASAVDSVTITNAATANPATVEVATSGSDSNVTLSLSAKGSGLVNINAGSGNAINLSSLTSANAPHLEFSSNKNGAGTVYMSVGVSRFVSNVPAVAMTSNGKVIWGNSTTNISTPTVSLCTSTTGILDVDGGAAANTACGTAANYRAAKASAYLAGGTKFTTDTGCGTVTSTTGGATAGKFTLAGNGSCAVVVTMGNSATAANGWACSLSNRTTLTVQPQMTADSTTTATFTFPTGSLSGDVIDFACMGY